MPDMQISITGSGIRAGDVVVNIATGAQVIRYDTEFKPGEYEIRPYLEGSYLYTISNMPSGRNLDVLIRFIKEMINTITDGNISAQDVWKSVHKAKLIPDEDLRVETSFYRNPFFPDGGAITGITMQIFIWRPFFMRHFMIWRKHTGGLFRNWELIKRTLKGWCAQAV